MSTEEMLNQINDGTLEESMNQSYDNMVTEFGQSSDEQSIIDLMDFDYRSKSTKFYPDILGKIYSMAEVANISEEDKENFYVYMSAANQIDNIEDIERVNNIVVLANQKIEANLDFEPISYGKAR